METAGVEPASEIISSSSHPQAWKIFLNQQNFSDLTVVGDRFLFDFYNLSVVLTRLDRRLWSASLIKPLGEQNQSVRYYWQLIGFDFLSHHDCLHYSFLLPRRILNVPVNYARLIALLSVIKASAICPYAVPHAVTIRPNMIAEIAPYSIAVAPLSSLMNVNIMTLLFTTPHWVSHI